MDYSGDPDTNITLKSFSILTTHPRIKSDEKLIETKLKVQNKNGCHSQL